VEVEDDKKNLPFEYDSSLSLSHLEMRLVQKICHVQALLDFTHSEISHRDYIY
jgi:hypothetical protein